ncbi:short-chain dehydrogenase/reductase SDR [Beutenbergia cavernae DSM 12333]|uniref:Short-chain dehydrogenase/reductase SDR n=1 Tax=Beutenbergia cavernae (strain ATCC BAA-8 / DSM 12333 / CCUG 43141 / JCM 11478 / NBRC 16432 / NCIMB 13614 / HKI 0122) TaxID=471853 RepID=C5C664_BEUC1|nr:SDR family oxidoreductase [Beutenbergia cavernae]ACQ82422.1 short-chain dehydrogenase/reductase SDR [Beutenbergia cavernae DSM 12333]
MSAAGRVAVVTGGATGIGRATCLELARRGIEEIHVGYSRSAQAAEDLAAELRGMGAVAHPLLLDVSDRDAVGRAAAHVLETSGGLDVLVNSAGTTEKIEFADLDAVTPELWDELLGVNLVGAFWVCQAFAESMRRRGGSIVNVTSIAGTRAVGSSLPYGVSKAALAQLTRGLAVALAPAVRVNAVAPGTVISGWHERLVGAEAARRTFDAEADLVPLGRLADADDIGHAIVTVALDLPFVTGQEVLVDGGKALRY